MLRLALLLLCASCASPSVEIPNQAWDDSSDARLEIPEGLRMGTDPLSRDTPALEGDRVLVAVRLFDEDGERLRFVRVTRLGVLRATGGGSLEIHDGENDFVLKWGKSQGHVRVEVFDAEGTELAAREREATMISHIEQNVLIAYCPDLLTPLLDLVSETPELEAFLQEVIAKPSLFSILQNGGVKVDLTLDARSEYRTRSSHGGLEVYGDRLTLEANGALALDARVFHTWRQSPFLLTAGVLRLEGQHPTDASRRVVLEVLGARRGGRPGE